MKEGQKHSLKEAGEMTPYGEIYSVTVFHQIHCLGMLRGNYWELLNRAFEQDDLVLRSSNWLLTPPLSLSLIKVVYRPITDDLSLIDIIETIRSNSHPQLTCKSLFRLLEAVFAVCCGYES